MDGQPGCTVITGRKGWVDEVTLRVWLRGGHLRALPRPGSKPSSFAKAFSSTGRRFAAPHRTSSPSRAHVLGVDVRFHVNAFTQGVAMNHHRPCFEQRDGAPPLPRTSYYPEAARWLKPGVTFSWPMRDRCSPRSSVAAPLSRRRVPSPATSTQTRADPGFHGRAQPLFLTLRSGSFLVCARRRSAVDPQRIPDRVDPRFHGRAHDVRSVSPGHFDVASIPILEPRPATGDAKSR